MTRKRAEGVQFDTEGMRKRLDEMVRMRYAPFRVTDAMKKAEGVRIGRLLKSGLPREFGADLGDLGKITIVLNPYDYGRRSANKDDENVYFAVYKGWIDKKGGVKKEIDAELVLFLPPEYDRETEVPSNFDVLDNVVLAEAYFWVDGVPHKKYHPYEIRDHTNGDTKGEVKRRLEYEIDGVLERILKEQ